jgi:hypothetical protein
MRPTGIVSVSRIVDGFGKEISLEKAIRYGWITPDDVYGAPNLFVDQGRQLLAYCFAFRAPIEDYTCSKFGVGTGVTAATVTDVGLEAPVALSSGSYTGPLDSIDFLTAFVVRASFTLGLSDANGSLITEMGLFSGNDSLMARRVRTVGINKTSDFAPTLTWRLRF